MNLVFQYYQPFTTLVVGPKAWSRARSHLASEFAFAMHLGFTVFNCTTTNYIAQRDQIPTNIKKTLQRQTQVPGVNRPWAKGPFTQIGNG